MGLESIEAANVQIGTPGRWTRLAGRVLLVLWAGFWSWFALMVGRSEGAVAVIPVTSVVLGTLVTASVPWKWPRVGGVLALAVALVAACVFPGASAWWLMALPPAVGGVLVLVGSRWRG